MINPSHLELLWHSPLALIKNANATKFSNWVEKNRAHNLAEIGPTLGFWFHYCLGKF